MALRFVIQSLDCLNIHGRGLDERWIGGGVGGEDSRAHICDDALDLETEPSEESLKTCNNKKKTDLIKGKSMQEEKVGGKQGGGGGG